MGARVLQLEQQQAGVLQQLKVAQQRNRHIEKEQEHITREVEVAKEEHKDGMEVGGVKWSGVEWKMKHGPPQLST